MKILFLPDNIEIEADKGDNLLHLAEKANILIDGSCAGTGLCGKCKIKILSGISHDVTTFEKKALTPSEIAQGYRLACQTQIYGDMKIEVPGTHNGSSRKKNMMKLPDNFIPDPYIKKVHVKVKKPKMDNQKSDIERIESELGNITTNIDIKTLSKVHQILNEKKGDATIVLRNNNIIGIEAGDTSSKCYGIAFDIGTTTVVGTMWDMNTLEITGVAARTNPQSNYGADVISRIQFCNQDTNNLNIMQNKIILCFNDIISEFTSSYNIKSENIYDITVVGNTTMSHLFLGITPASLARTPFAPVFCKGINTSAKKLGLIVNYNANLFFLPNIAGHVGADIMGVLLSTNLKYLEGANIAIDIGTNGEVLLAQNGEILACSTAAGPAFEGAAIYNGMRAANGAIEGVLITENDVKLKVIENESPIGICGSGLIDAIAQMLDAGLIDKKGRLIERKEALEKNIHENIAKRLIKKDEMTAFILAYRDNAEDIIITQQDVREVQLAKGAIYAGMKTLMKNLNLEDKDITSIILAGAFGNYIKKESALRIGLLPNIDINKIISAGNAAEVGSCMTLLSKKCRNDVLTLAKEAKHIELSMNMDFQDAYMFAMLFPD